MRSQYMVMWVVDRCKRYGRLDWAWQTFFRVNR